MKKIFDLLKHNILFQTIDFGDFEQMLSCLSAKTASYRKDEVILLSGDAVHFVGLVLSGGVKVIKEDPNGHMSILSMLSVSDVFGETFACAGVSSSPVTVQATEDTKVLLINYKKIITTCSAACPFHAKLIENMLRLIAQKNLILNQKIEILSKRTTREKLLCFFDAQRNGQKTFTIPFNREEMAHYLCVDRSAMSNELSKMRAEGLIQFKKNTFEIHS